MLDFGRRSGVAAAGESLRRPEAGLRADELQAVLEQHLCSAPGLDRGRRAAARPDQALDFTSCAAVAVFLLGQADEFGAVIAESLAEPRG